MVAAATSSAVAVLRLTCHAVKHAVNHALAGVLQGRLALFSTLCVPLDQFLAYHFFFSGQTSSLPLPLLSDSAEAAHAKKRFRELADLTLGVAQARLHQSRLDEVLDYVWRVWAFAPHKLESLRELLLAPPAVPDVGNGQPLLKVEYLRREDDYLCYSYALGIRACLSLGLPDLPHERVDLGLWVLQAWDHRDAGWDLHVFVDLRTCSASWKQRLGPFSSSASSCEDEGDPSAPVHMVVFDYNRSRGYLMCETTANFGLLCELWRCLGLPAKASREADADADADANAEAYDRQLWTGFEVLTTLLACVGFAWHDDVQLLWEDLDAEAEDEDFEDALVPSQRR